jgi:hypothetical protein
VPAAQVGRGLAALGLHRRTIYTWLSKDRAEGRAALRAKPVPGRRRKLTDAQLGELIDQTDPRDHGFAVALWPDFAQISAHLRPMRSRPEQLGGRRGAGLRP